MKYGQPFDQPLNPTAPYVDADPVAGVNGSIPPARFFNNVQAELINLIRAGGLTPTDDNLHQVRDAVLALIPTPTGAPADAALVHFGRDVGSANAFAVTPSPSVTSVADGFICFWTPQNDSSSPRPTLSIIPSSGPPVVRQILRDNGSDLIPMDIRSGRVVLTVYDSALNAHRIVNLRAVATDGVTIRGGGGDADPLTVVFPPPILGGLGPAIGQVIFTQTNADPMTSSAQIGVEVAAETLQSGSNQHFSNAPLGTMQAPQKIATLGFLLSGTYRLIGWQEIYFSPFSNNWTLFWQRVA